MHEKKQGITALPYLYYSSDCPFASPWFDYLITLMFWANAVELDVTSSAMAGSRNYDDAVWTVGRLYVEGNFVTRLFLWFSRLVDLTVFIVVYSISIYWVPRATSPFEKGWTSFMITLYTIFIFMIICLSFQRCVIWLLGYDNLQVSPEMVRDAEEEYDFNWDVRDMDRKRRENAIMQPFSDPRKVDSLPYGAKRQPCPKKGET